MSQSSTAATETTGRVITGPDISQIIMALALVILMVFVLAFLSKFVPAMRYNAGQNIKIIEALSLGNREKLMIIEVNQQQLLVGLSQNGMQTLHILDEPVTVNHKQESPFSARLVAAMQGQKSV